MKGRKRQPTKLKELKGTADKRWINSDEPKAEPLSEIPSPPAKLNARGKKIWGDVCKWLKEIDMLHSIDLYNLAAYCREMAMYHTCMEMVEKQGAVIPFENGKQEMMQINPAYKAAKMAFDNAMKVADKFGFNPSSRAQLNVKAQPKKQSPVLSKMKIAK